MSFTKYTPKTRVPDERVLMRNGQFAKYLSRKTGVSSAALSKALNIISSGLVDALADGYNVNINALGTFEFREMPPHRRYHHQEKRIYMAPGHTVVHFRKSENLSKRVRRKAEAKLEDTIRKPTTSPNDNK